MGGMKRHGEWTNSCLAEVVGRFQEHARAVREGDPYIQGPAKVMCSIGLWEMWALTQD